MDLMKVIMMQQESLVPQLRNNEMMIRVDLQNAKKNNQSLESTKHSDEQVRK
jgi:hypothetical protein